MQEASRGLLGAPFKHRMDAEGGSQLLVVVVVRSWASLDTQR